MPAASASAVLHITAAAGGGADRYIRDLTATASRRHFVLHVGAAVDVLEDVRARRFVPLAALTQDADREAIDRWLGASRIGIAHLHSVDRYCRGRLDALLDAERLPYIVTLHDLLFVNPAAFESIGMPEPDKTWIAEATQALADASTVIVPSDFILGVAREWAPELRMTVVPPGIRTFPSKTVPAAPADFALHSPRRVIAVVGAVGPHKGSRLLDALAATLADSDIGIVVIGYTDRMLTRGWVVPRSLYVHGPYLDHALAGWLAAYRAELVLFPNRLPESFSYTLSEVWAAGVPVIVPGEGALGERVAKHGGGWQLSPGFGVDEAATLLKRLLSAEGEPLRARVKSLISPTDSARIPTLEAMSRDVDALYARYALPPASTGDIDAAREALAPLLAANLDGFVFRKELLSLAGQLEQAKLDAAEATRWSMQLERDGAAWAAKLEADIAAVRRDYAADIARHVAEHRRLEEQNGRSTDEVRRLGKQNAKLDADNRRLSDQADRLVDEKRRLAKQNAKLAEDARRLDELAEELRVARQALDEAQQRIAQGQREASELIAKHAEEMSGERREHARDIERVTEELHRSMADEMRPLAEEKRRLGDELVRAGEENRRLRDEIARLGPYQAAFEVGPQILQKYLLRKLSRARR